MSKEGVSKRTKRVEWTITDEVHSGYYAYQVRYGQNRTLCTLRTLRAGGKPEGSEQRRNACLYPKATKCQEKAINGEWEEVWKSVEKTPILQPINYQVIIKSVEMVEKKISTA